MSKSLFVYDTYMHIYICTYLFTDRHTHMCRGIEARDMVGLPMALAVGTLKGLAQKV